MTAKDGFSAGTRLIPMDKWLENGGGKVDDEKIKGNDGNVISSPIMNIAFNRVLELHEPKHDIAYLSLCTATRPYSKSQKWAHLKAKFNDFVDLVIMSNGGLVPIEFENEYPYTVYDAHGTPEFDDLYKDVLVGRLLRFFTKHNYKRIIFHTPYKQRNNEACKMAGKALLAMGAITDFAVLPTNEDYDKVFAREYKKEGFNYNPTLHPDCFNPTIELMNEWIKHTGKIIPLDDDPTIKEKPPSVMDSGLFTTNKG